MTSSYEQRIAASPTIGVARLERLVRRAFGLAFVRMEVRARVRRSEKITIYVRIGEPSEGRDWTHKLVYSHDRPRGDLDAVRKHVRSNLKHAIAARHAREGR